VLYRPPASPSPHPNHHAHTIRTPIISSCNPRPVTPLKHQQCRKCSPFYPKCSRSHPTEGIQVQWQALKAASCHIAKQLSLQDVLSFFVLLARLKCLIILPAYRLVALSAGNISHYVSARGHIPLTGIARRDVDDIVEEVCFAMLATEILAGHVSNGFLPG
jgi:hypothetical protein